MNAEELGKKIARLIADRDAKHAADVAALRAHIEELRAQVKAMPPARDGRDGLPGVPGAPGEKGEPGKDAVITVEEIQNAVEYDGARSLKFFGREFTLPVPIYRGIYERGAEYSAHDMVTWGGSMWMCTEKTTDAPRDGAGGAWKLVVKKGRDAALAATNGGH